jgi:hypothetical protein
MGVFSGGEVWTGGFYELALEYERGIANGLVTGLQQLWQLEELDGCYLERERDPVDQSRVAFKPSLATAGHLLGVATLAGGVRVACGSCTIQETDGSDWLVFYFPMSALGNVYPVGGFPFDSGNHEGWRIPLDDWSANVGRRIYPTAPFALGLVGFETSGCSSHPDARFRGLRGFFSGFGVMSTTLAST